MKRIFLYLFLFTSVCMIAQDHANIKIENVVVNTNSRKTRVTTNQKGGLVVNVSQKESRIFQP